MYPVRILCPWLLLLVFLAAEGAIITPTHKPPPVTTLPKAEDTQPLQPAIERGLVKLCLGLQKASTASSLKGENVIFSPLSIAAVHALLLAAATEVTKHELETLFGVENIPYRQEVLHQTLSSFIFHVENNEQIEQYLVSANGLFPQEDKQVNPEYIKFAKSFYKSEVIPMNFKRNSQETTDFINKWVSNRTEGKIRQILENAVDTTTSLIIANAFYFKGSWENPFTVNYTKMQNFTISKGLIIQVPMMVSMLDAWYGFTRGSHAVLGLPYKGGDLVMYFVLPSTDLRQFIDTLTVDSVYNFINQTSRQNVIVAIPRMKVESSLELSKPLYSMGLQSMFNRFTSRLGALGRGSHVSEMVHKVAVEVTEYGTEAAASTSTIIHRDGSMPVFRADKPFLFFIHQRSTNAILFWGTVFRPIA